MAPEQAALATELMLAARLIPIHYDGYETPALASGWLGRWRRSEPAGRGPAASRRRVQPVRDDLRAHPTSGRRNAPTAVFHRHRHGGHRCRAQRAGVLTILP